MLLSRTTGRQQCRWILTISLPPPFPFLNRHNNYTGRWLTRFRAIWDPKRDDCFVVGSMSRPRQIEAFHATGDLVHSFLSEDYLGSVCSINAWHPTRYILAGGNSSGRLHVFKEWKKVEENVEPSGNKEYELHFGCVRTLSLEKDEYIHFQNFLSDLDYQ